MASVRHTSRQGSTASAEIKHWASIVQIAGCRNIPLLSSGPLCLPWTPQSCLQFFFQSSRCHMPLCLHSICHYVCVLWWGSGESTRRIGERLDQGIHLAMVGNILGGVMHLAPAQHHWHSQMRASTRLTPQTRRQRALPSTHVMQSLNIAASCSHCQQSASQLKALLLRWPRARAAPATRRECGCKQRV